MKQPVVFLDPDLVKRLRRPDQIVIGRMENHQGNMHQTPVKRKKIYKETDDTEEDLKETSPKKSKFESTVELEIVKENTKECNNVESIDSNEGKSNSDTGSNAELERDLMVLSDAIKETEPHENEESIQGNVNVDRLQWIQDAAEEHVTLPLDTETKTNAVTVLYERNRIDVEANAIDGWKDENAKSVDVDNKEIFANGRSDVKSSENVEDFQNNAKSDDVDKKDADIFAGTRSDVKKSENVEDFQNNASDDIVENAKSDDVDKKDADIFADARSDVKKSENVEDFQNNASDDIVENAKSDDVDKKDEDIFADARSDVKKSENVEDFQNNASDNIAENDENFLDEDKVEKVVEFEEIFFYRLLRPGEPYENGIFPKNIKSSTTINDHVAHGSSLYQSRYVSCAKSEEKVRKFAGIIRKNERCIQRKIVKIAKSKLGNDVTIIDLSEESNRKLHLYDNRAIKFAIQFDEVLLAPETAIPAESITVIAHIRNGEITPHSGN